MGNHVAHINVSRIALIPNIPHRHVRYRANSPSQLEQAGRPIQPARQPTVQLWRCPTQLYPGTGRGRGRWQSPSCSSCRAKYVSRQHRLTRRCWCPNTTPLIPYTRYNAYPSSALAILCAHFRVATKLQLGTVFRRSGRWNVTVVPPHPPVHVVC